MADPKIKALLADPEELAELLSKALPDDKVTAEDIAARLNKLHELDDPRLDLDGLLEGLEHTALEDIEELAINEARQLAAINKHTLYSITARHHRVEPYEADWNGTDCQQVRVTLAQSAKRIGTPAA